MIAENFLPQRYALAAFWRVLHGTSFKNRAALEKWQNKKIAHWLHQSVQKSSYYHSMDCQELYALPIMDKQTMMAHFHQFNKLAITNEQLRKRLQTNDQPEHHTIGMSTGTSGNRTLYVISEKERYQWLGNILAKLLPNYPFESARIAVALPTATPLYQSANHMWRLHLKFFDLNSGLDRCHQDICDFAPDTIIAPPHLLVHLAEHNYSHPVKRLFSAAEVLDPFDRQSINAHFGTPVREIYMASEGLLATPCPYGTLHLCEDIIHFECEAVDDQGLITPIISDFSRTTQIIARYRMNDLLRLSKHPCPCGSVFRSIEEVVGRSDDIFVFKDHNSKTIRITPDIMRNCILDASQHIEDFRLYYEGDNQLRLVLSETVTKQSSDDAVKALYSMLHRKGIEPAILTARQKLEFIEKGKLRRIKNCTQTNRDIS